MKKVLFFFLLLAICLPSLATERICTDSLGIWGGSGPHCPKPASAPVSYSVDYDLGLVSFSTRESEQVRVQIIGQISGLVDDELFYGSSSVVLYNHDFYEIRFILYSGKTYIDYFYL